MINLGTGSLEANAFAIDIFLSTDNSITSSDYNIARLMSGPVGAGPFLGYELSTYANIAGYPNGEYYLGIIVDPTNAISEDDESNNTGCATNSKVTPVCSHDIDFVVTGMEIDNLGDPIRFHYEIRNMQTFGGDPPLVTMCVYLTKYGSITESYYLVTAQQYQIFPSTDVHTYLGEIRQADIAAVNVPAGNYYLTVVADIEGNIIESNEDNNISSTSLAQIEVRRDNYDLQLSDLSVTDANGPEIKYQYVLRNNGTQGTIAPNTFTIASYLSPELAISSSDYLIDSFRNEIAIGAGVGMNANPTVNISGVPDGVYYLGIIVDPTNAVVETDELNNSIVTASPLVQINSTPSTNYDLLVNNLTASDAEGPDISFSFSLANDGTSGTIPAHLFYTKSYLSNDAVITPSDYMIFSYQNQTEMNPGSVINVTANSIDISSVPDGNYYLGVIADVNNEITESNEGNNSVTTSTAMVHKETIVADNFDLVLTEFNLTDWTGPDIVCSYKIKNLGTQGSIPVNTFFVNTYLSLDADVTPDDYQIGSYWNHEEITAGGVLEEDQSMITEAVPNGDYFLGILLDAGNLLTETDETNNKMVTTTSQIKIIESTDAVSEANDLPIDFKLYQNYPNPFNPTTNIQFSIPEEAMVTLTINDVLGRQVCELVHQRLGAGIYSYEFDASKLTNGIYLYKIIAGKYTQIKKMLLIK